MNIIRDKHLSQLYDLAVDSRKRLYHIAIKDGVVNAIHLSYIIGVIISLLLFLLSFVTVLNVCWWGLLLLIELFIFCIVFFSYLYLRNITISDSKLFYEIDKVCGNHNAVLNAYSLCIIPEIDIYGVYAIKHGIHLLRDSSPVNLSVKSKRINYFILGLANLVIAFLCLLTVLAEGTIGEHPDIPGNVKDVDVIAIDNVDENHKAISNSEYGRVVHEGNELEQIKKRDSQSGKLNHTANLLQSKSGFVNGNSGYVSSEGVVSGYSQEKIEGLAMNAVSIAGNESVKKQLDKSKINNKFYYESIESTKMEKSKRISSSGSSVNAARNVLISDNKNITNSFREDKNEREFSVSNPKYIDGVMSSFYNKNNLNHLNYHYSSLFQNKKGKAVSLRLSGVTYPVYVNSQELPGKYYIIDQKGIPGEINDINILSSSVETSESSNNYQEYVIDKEHTKRYFELLRAIDNYREDHND